MQRRILFRQRVLSPTVVGEGWLRLSTDVCLQLFAESSGRTHRGVMTGPCAQAQSPGLWRTALGGREHCWEVSRRNFSVGVSFLGW